MKPEEVFKLFREERETRLASYKLEVENILTSVSDENMPAPGFHEGIVIDLNEI